MMVLFVIDNIYIINRKSKLLFFFFFFYEKIYLLDFI